MAVLRELLWDLEKQIQNRIGSDCLGIGVQNEFLIIGLRKRNLLYSSVLSILNFSIRKPELKNSIEDDKSIAYVAIDLSNPITYKNCRSFLRIESKSNMVRSFTSNPEEVIFKDVLLLDAEQEKYRAIFKENPESVSAKRTDPILLEMERSNERIISTFKKILEKPNKQLIYHMWTNNGVSDEYYGELLRNITGSPVIERTVTTKNVNNKSNIKIKDDTMKQLKELDDFKDELTKILRTQVYVHIDQSDEYKISLFPRIKGEIKMESDRIILEREDVADDENNGTMYQIILPIEEPNGFEYNKSHKFLSFVAKEEHEFINFQIYEDESSIKKINRLKISNISYEEYKVLTRKHHAVLFAIQDIERMELSKSSKQVDEVKKEDTQTLLDDINNMLS